MSTFSWLWSEKTHNAWEMTRQEGMRRFILVRGVLSWGLPMFVLMAGGPVFFAFPHPAEPTVSYWLIQAAIWTLCGAIFGWSMWHHSERQFRKHGQSAP